jgi:hypothetical protein
MSWAKPWNLWLRGQQNFNNVKKELENHAKENERRGEVSIYNGNSRNYAIRAQEHKHPLSSHCHSEVAMCVRHYDTDILQFFKDGTIRVDDYDSKATRDIIRSLGPIAQFNDRNGRRWRPHGSWDDPDYPLNNPVVIHPDGYVHEWKEKKRRVKADAKPERKRIRQKFIKNALGRILLGEFPEMLVRDHDGTWIAQIPQRYSNKEEMYRLFLAGASHNEIQATMQDVPMDPISWAFGRRVISYPSSDKAAYAIVNSLLRDRMDRTEDYERYEVTFPPIKVLDR